jgi:dTDP-4-amino-4,6-dideoxygalactose transaminase/predicted dehydrogenase
MIRTALSTAKAHLRRTVLDTMLRRLMPDQSGGGRRPFDVEELKLLRQALMSQNLCCIDGQMVPAFERAFAYAYGVPYGVASTSGTAAIHVALGALDLNPGDEVITAPITDMGTIIPILYQNAIPVFADIDHTFNMDPAAVERCMTPRTKAIIVVHLFGNPCDMDAMLAIARRHGVALIEDCSQAHLAEYKGKLVGTIGDIGCFSFQQSKHMTTGDGGMTITSNAAYYERMKLFADKGYARKGWGARAYLFHAPNYRMNELTGAVGIAQLRKLKGVVEKRRELGGYLSERLSQIEGVQTAPITPGATHSYWLYPLLLDRLPADQFAKEMIDQRVWVSAGYTGKPIYLCSESLTAKKTYGTSQCPFTCDHTTGVHEYKEGLCPRAEQTLPRLICIPLDEGWTRANVDKAATAVSTVVQKLTTGATSSVTRRPPEPASGPAVQSAKGKIRVGIVGCGQMGRWHLDAYRKNPNVEVVAFADSDLRRAEAFARSGGKAYRSHRELLENASLDAVSVCTVPSSHREIVIDALDAGAHVLCEKPLAASVAEAEEMSRKARQRNRLLLTGFKYRFHEEVRKAKELIESGSFGEIVNCRVMFGGYLEIADTWYADKQLSGGGIIMDNGPHAIDLIRFLLGNIKSISARADHMQRLAVEDTATLSLSLDTGARATAELSWCVPVPPRAYLEIYGRGGTALLDFQGVSYKFGTWSDWKRAANTSDAQGAFARQLQYFADAIGGSNPLGLGRNEGLMAQRVIEAAYESVSQNREIEVATGELVPAFA